jgi:hypothetical protein
MVLRPGGAFSGRPAIFRASGQILDWKRRLLTMYPCDLHHELASPRAKLRFPFRCVARAFMASLSSLAVPVSFTVPGPDFWDAFEDKEDKADWR